MCNVSFVYNFPGKPSAWGGRVQLVVPQSVMKAAGSENRLPSSCLSTEHNAMVVVLPPVAS